MSELYSFEYDRPYARFPDRRTRVTRFHASSPEEAIERVVAFTNAAHKGKPGARRYPRPRNLIPTSTRQALRLPWDRFPKDESNVVDLPSHQNHSAIELMKAAGNTMH